MKRIEQELYYRNKADNMEAMAIFWGVVALFLMVPTMIVLCLLGLSEESAKVWMYVVFVPSLVCSVLFVYFNFRAWLAEK